MARLGELFDGPIRSISKATHPGVRANHGLYQTRVARIFRCAGAFDRGCCIPRHVIPPDFDLSAGAVSVAGSSGRYQQLIAGNNDALKHCNEVRPILGFYWSLA